MALNVLAAGICTIDLIASVATFPPPDGRMDMRSFTQSVGGIAAVAGVAAARLGARVGFAGLVEDDAAGYAIRATLAAAGVDVALLSVSRDLATPTAVIISAVAGGTRSILNHPGIASFRLAPSEALARAAETARVLHLDHTAFPMLTDAVLPRCRAAGTLVSLDAGVAFPGIETYLPLIDIHVTTDRQVAAMTGAGGVAHGLARVRAAGPRVVAATLGADGSVGLAADGTAIVAPAFAVPIVDTTGAGDVFHGAFLQALLEGQAMAQALTFANAAAALSCRAVGGHPGCPTLAAVRALVATQ